MLRRCRRKAFTEEEAPLRSNGWSGRNNPVRKRKRTSEKTTGGSPTGRIIWRYVREKSPAITGTAKTGIGLGRGDMTTDGIIRTAARSRADTGRHVRTRLFRLHPTDL